MHPLNRPFQAETYQSLIKSPQKYVIIRAPVGSGKSAFAAQAGHDGHRVMALMKTKVLQEQYAGSYQFQVVKGKGSYPCLGNFAPACDLCHLKGREKQEVCNPVCPYPHAVSEMLDSRFACLNYSKFLLETRQGGLIDKYEPDILFLDECHQLSDIVIEWSGLTLSWQKAAEYIEPEFISPYAPQKKQVSLALDWLDELREILADSEPPLPRKDSSQEEIRQYRSWDVLFKKVQNTLKMVNIGREYWFCQSDQEGGFRLRPLTARFHFAQIFDRAKKVVLMSGTVKESDLSELGIYDSYDFIHVPNIWPAADRPIEDLHAPAYTAKSDYQERLYHAQIISNRINQTPNSWTGLIHVTSRKMAAELGKFLGQMTGRPIWTPVEGQGTEQALFDFQTFLARKRGGLGVTWQFFEGVDMGEINTVVTARLPYPDFSEPFEKQRFDFDKKAGISRVANLVEQQQGRNRRGYKEHYGPEAEKLNCIADGKWTRLKSSLAEDFVEAVI